jgi:hypothetical protein
VEFHEQYTIYYREEPVIIGGVAHDDGAADDLWSVLERFYLGITDRSPHRAMDWKAASVDAVVLRRHGGDGSVGLRNGGLAR